MAGGCKQAVVGLGCLPDVLFGQPSRFHSLSKPTQSQLHPDIMNKMGAKPTSGVHNTHENIHDCCPKVLRLARRFGSIFDRLAPLTLSSSSTAKPERRRQADPEPSDPKCSQVLQSATICTG